MTTSQPPTSLEDLEPAIEAVHHACRAGRYDAAADVAYDHVYLGDRALITSELSAFEAALSMFSDFFPDQDFRAEPLVTTSDSSSWLLHETATRDGRPTSPAATSVSVTFGSRSTTPMGHGRPTRRHCGSRRASRTDDSLANVLQALHMSVVGSYRLFEVDSRIILAQLRAHAGDSEAAWTELTQADEISIEIGYHWGRHDAARARETIARLRQRDDDVGPSA